MQALLVISYHIAIYCYLPFGHGKGRNDQTERQMTDSIHSMYAEIKYIQERIFTPPKIL